MSQKNAVSMTQKITITALFLALALVTKLLTTVYIPLFGANGMKVGIAGIFSAFPAILFGPLFGGITSALLDFLGTVIKPSGAYIPWFTITAFIGGFLKGLIWKGIKDRDEKILRFVSFFVLLATGGFGVVNGVLLRADQVDASFFHAETGAPAFPADNLSYISRLIIQRVGVMSNPAANMEKYIIYFTTALIAFAAFGLLVMGVEFLISKRMAQTGKKREIFKIFMALVLSGIVVTTINTELLRLLVYSSWQEIAFWLLWIPRVIEEVVVCMVQASMVAILYEIVIKKLFPSFTLAATNA